MITKQYAGPLPLKAVTASMSFSSTSTARPTAFKIASAYWTSSFFVKCPLATAAAPSPAMALTFGITLKTRGRLDKAFSITSEGTPATIEINSFDGFTTERIPFRVS